MSSFLKPFRLLAGVVLLGIFSNTYAVQITLDTGATTFNAEFKKGSSNIGVVFFSGRGGTNDGNFVKQVGTALNGQGYTTLSLDNPTAAGGSTSWTDYVLQEDSIDDQVFAYMNAALAQLSSQGVDHVVLAGLSLGARFMTSVAAAWDHGVYNPGYGIDLIGLVGASMYPDTGAPYIPLTTTNPTSIDDFNIYDVKSNLGFIDTTPVLDLYGNLDSKAADFADARRNAYGSDPGKYVQASIDCPAVDGSYYANLGGGKFVTYDVDRCHQLRDGYLPKPTGGFYLAHQVRAPMISQISAFMDGYAVPQARVPEPSSLFLMLMGIPVLLVSCRRRMSQH